MIPKAGEVRLAVAGYRVVAPDQRGYAPSEQPEAVERYSLLHPAGDVIGLVEALGKERVVLVGHDWGAPVAWVTAMLRPDVVRAVAGLSVPPVLPAGMAPPSVTREKFGSGSYQIYFQEPGAADAALARDPEATFRRILFAASGDNPSNDLPGPWIVPPGRLPPGHDAGADATAGLAHPGRHRGLRPRLRQPRRPGLHRRPELVPEHRTERRVARGLPRPPDRGTGAVRRRGP
ncbi:alpha/beta fold hydrolase [Streptomyces sp. NPDC096934]|uniref:alpha/beta fold hydrolase n=1 Tax=Streptomyces sp. NPDC096934 TaxID=3155551 RepID=UPI0033244C7C